MMRKAIARRLTESKRDVPHVYLTIDVDAGPLAELRERSNEDRAGAAKKRAKSPRRLASTICSC